MVLVTFFTVDQYKQIITESQRDVTIVACLCLAWVFILFMLSRRYRSYLHVFVLHLMFAMLLEIASVQFLDLVSKYNQLYWKFFWFALFFVGVMSTRTWMASMGFGVLLLLNKGPSVAEKAWLPVMLTAWGIPIAITVILVSICAANTERVHRNLVDISFLFGEAQLVVSLAILIICFLMTSVCVFLIIMTIWRFQKEVGLRIQNKDETVTPENTFSNGSQSSSPRSSLLIAIHNSSRPESPGFPQTSEPLKLNEEENERSFVKPLLVSQIEDQSRDVFENSANAPVTHGGNDNGFIDESTPLIALNKNEVQSNMPTADFRFGTLTANTGLWYRDNSGKNLIRFVILLLFLVFSSLVGILIVSWKIFFPDLNRFFIAVNVLDTITNFGQGFFVFLVFGFEKHWFWSTVYQKFRSLFFKMETVELPPAKDLDINVLTLCAIFRTKYLEQCRESILSDKRFYWCTYKSVFSGTDFVNWLIERGIVSNREDAVQYGHSLMLGRVIAHVQGEHYFHDLPYFYQFTST